ncbi:hypothetical protein BGW39_009797 [Mortierella sp. 14UC]|nr:hypothetical protein BGW39_009797 [Mortierella sp. 14UC]
MTPSSSSSALNTSTLSASESISPNSAQDDVASRDTVITPQEQYAPHEPGERMQSLSHMLEDRLSLASYRPEQGWDRLQSSNDEQQHYHEHHSRFSPPSHPDDPMHHSGRYLRERPRTSPTHSTALQRENDELRRHQLNFLQDGRSRQQHQQQDFRPHPQLLQNRQQAHEQQHHRAQSSSSMRDDRASPHYMTQVSPSPTIEPVAAVKLKRKYTKKSSLLPLSMAESRDQTTVADLHSKQQAMRNELLYSSRGLILKTQIPKKGRPISKHSTTSQSTPTLASLGILPASHHYFTKTGAGSSASLSASTVMSGLVTAASVVVLIMPRHLKKLTHH